MPRARRQRLTRPEVVRLVGGAEAYAALNYLDRDGAGRLVLGQPPPEADDHERHTKRTFLQQYRSTLQAEARQCALSILCVRKSSGVAR